MAKGDLSGLGAIAPNKRTPLGSITQLASALKTKAANTQGLAQPVDYGSSVGAAPASTLAAIPDSQLKADLIAKGILVEGMPVEQSMAIMALQTLAGQVPTDIAALMKMIEGNYANYSGDILTAGTDWMQQLYGNMTMPNGFTMSPDGTVIPPPGATFSNGQWLDSAGTVIGAADSATSVPYDPNDPNAALMAQDPTFTSYAGGLAQMDETADLNLNNDLAWFAKQQQMMTDYYNSLSGTVASTPMETGGSGGGGGGYGGGYGGGGGGSSYDDDGDLVEKEKVDIRNTDWARSGNKQVFEAKNPGFHAAMLSLFPPGSLEQQLAAEFLGSPETNEPEEALGAAYDANNELVAMADIRNQQLLSNEAWTNAAPGLWGDPTNWGEKMTAFLESNNILPDLQYNEETGSWYTTNPEGTLEGLPSADDPQNALMQQVFDQLYNPENAEYGLDTMQSIIGGGNAMETLALKMAQMNFEGPNSWSTSQQPDRTFQGEFGGLNQMMLDQFIPGSQPTASNTALGTVPTSAEVLENLQNDPTPTHELANSFDWDSPEFVLNFLLMNDPTNSPSEVETGMNSAVQMLQEHASEMSPETLAFVQDWAEQSAVQNPDYWNPVIEATGSAIRGTGSITGKGFTPDWLPLQEAIANAPDTGTEALAYLDTLDPQVRGAVEQHLANQGVIGDPELGRNLMDIARKARRNAVVPESPGFFGNVGNMFENVANYQQASANTPDTLTEAVEAYQAGVWDPWRINQTLATLQDASLHEKEIAMSAYEDSELFNSTVEPGEFWIPETDIATEEEAAEWQIQNQVYDQMVQAIYNQGWNKYIDMAPIENSVTDQTAETTQAAQTGTIYDQMGNLIFPEGDLGEQTIDQLDPVPNPPPVVYDKVTTPKITRMPVSSTGSVGDSINFSTNLLDNALRNISLPTSPTPISPSQIQSLAARKIQGIQNPATTYPKVNKKPRQNLSALKVKKR